ncbi:MAG TPA: glycosyltransferase family 2 protein [Coriobacteriia bacterium]
MAEDTGNPDAPRDVGGSDVSPERPGVRRAGEPRVAVLIPCYNEERTIAKVVGDFGRIAPGATVYVYDNNSTDASGRLAAEAGAIVVPEYRQGKGFVIRSMFRDIDADCYVMVDADDTYPADEAMAMVDLVVSGEADMVIGDRLSSTYFQENKRRLHGVGNRLVRMLVNRIFRSDIKDIMTGCRCFSRRFVRAFPVLSTGFEIETEMTIHALDKGFLVREVPITYRDRVEGSQSKLRTVSDGARVLRTIASLFKDYRPLQFFGLVALVLFAVSTAMFVPPLDEYLVTGYVRRVPTLVVSIAFGISALLSLVCAVVLDSTRKQSRQFYELALTAFALREAGRDPRGGR